MSTVNVTFPNQYRYMIKRDNYFPSSVGYPVPAEGIHPTRQDHGPERHGEAELRAGGLQDPQPQRRRHPEKEVR